MDLLSKLFPGISELDSLTIPYWPDNNEPWSILDGSSPNGIRQQISSMPGNKDGVIIEPSAQIGEGVVIEGPCYIGPNAEIRHSAYLRPGSWICEGALVGHSSEIKNSVLLPKAKAPHFNYVGDSIIGLDANLGAGAKISNVRNDRRGIIVTFEDGSRVETGLTKMGAMIGDSAQIGCNVVTNPGSIISPGTMVDPNQMVSGWL